MTKHLRVGPGVTGLSTEGLWELEEAAPCLTAVMNGGFAVGNPANGLTICHDSAEEDAVLIADCTTNRPRRRDRQTGTQTDPLDD